MYKIWNDRLGDYYRGPKGKPFLYPSLEDALARMEELGWLHEMFHRVRICDLNGNDVQVFLPS